MKMTQVIDNFVAGYSGRDMALAARLDNWREALGQAEMAEVSAEMVESAMDWLAARGALPRGGHAARTAAGQPLTPSMLNRYRAALGSVIKFARQRRLVPRTWSSPLRGVRPLPENRGRTVCLSAEQVERLIACARMARWRPPSA